MMLYLRGEARKGRYLAISREHFASTGQSSGVADWHAWEDHGGGSSLARMVHDASQRQEVEEGKNKRRNSALIKYRRYQEEEERRRAAGQKPLRRGTRRACTRPRQASAQFADPRPTADTRLRRPLEQLELAIDRWTTEAKLASMKLDSAAAESRPQDV